MDHEARLQVYADRIDVILSELRGVPGIEAVRVSSIEQPAPVLRDGVRIRVAPGRSAEDVMKRLQDGEPSIWVRTYGDFVNVSVAWLPEAQVAARSAAAAGGLNRHLTPHLSLRAIAGLYSDST